MARAIRSKFRDICPHCYGTVPEGGWIKQKDGVWYHAKCQPRLSRGSVHVKMEKDAYPDKSASWCRKEARKRVSQYIKCPIPDGWEVHHKNLDYTDNGIGNLALLPKKEHARLHYKISGYGRKKFIRSKMNG